MPSSNLRLENEPNLLIVCNALNIELVVQTLYLLVIWYAEILYVAKVS